MRVTPKDSGSFEVTSSDDRDNYTVILDGDHGFPHCTCRDFQCRCHPKLQPGARMILYGNLERNTCKHVRAVIQYLGQSVQARMAGKQRTDIWKDEL